MTKLMRDDQFVKLDTVGRFARCELLQGRFIQNDARRLASAFRQIQHAARRHFPAICHHLNVAPLRQYARRNCAVLGAQRSRQRTRLFLICGWRR